MTWIFSAESAAVDNGLRSCLLLCKETLALAGDRGECVESGGHKISVFPASKTNSPPQAKDLGIIAFFDFLAHFPRFFKTEFTGWPLGECSFVKKGGRHDNEDRNQMRLRDLGYKITALLCPQKKCAPRALPVARGWGT